MSCSKQQTGSEGHFSDAEAIQAHSLPYTRAYINYQGMLTESKVSAISRTGEVDFLFEVDDQIHIKESYSYDEKTFRYLGDADEHYSPGITLLQFPFDTGDSWQWSGQYSFDETQYDSKAEIKTASERLTTLAGEYDTIVVTCNLEIDSGSLSPVLKELKFWIVPGKGIVRREIQFGASREPMPNVSEDE